jgi:hypothetical protein
MRYPLAMSKPMIVFLSALVGGAVLVAIALAVLPLQDSTVAPQARQAPQTPQVPQSPNHWSESERATFIEACAKSCRNSAGATATGQALCERVCACSADEGEKFLTVNELAAIVLAEKVGMASSDQKEKMQKLKDAGLACARKLAQ